MARRRRVLLALRAERAALRVRRQHRREGGVGRGERRGREDGGEGGEHEAEHRGWELVGVVVLWWWREAPTLLSWLCFTGGSADEVARPAPALHSCTQQLWCDQSL